MPPEESWDVKNGSFWQIIIITIGASIIMREAENPWSTWSTRRQAELNLECLVSADHLIATSKEE